MVYGLGRRGAPLLDGRLGPSRGRADHAEKTRGTRGIYLDHAIDVSDFMVSLELACRARSNVRIIYPDEIVRSPSPSLQPQRNPLSWQVRVPWRGREETL